MHVFVPDTNFFLQCKDYDQLDWSLATSDSEITIAVPRVVQREIDRHKDGGNARRASRARKAWTTFAQIIDSVDNRITTRSKGCTISLELLMPRLKADDFPHLDLQSPDDQIVAEAFWLQQQRPDAIVTFLSNDTPALTTAKSMALPFRRPPLQWALPPEKDERDKMIDELRKKIDLLSNQYPALTFTLPDIPDNRISTRTIRFPALTRSEIQLLVKDMKELFPMEAHFPQDPPKRESGRHFGFAAIATSHERWEPARSEDIEYYQKKAYPEWLRQIQSELENVHQRLNNDSLLKFTVAIENVGRQPAMNLLISYRTEGSIIFDVPSTKQGDEESGGSKPLFSDAPTPPSGKYANLMDRFVQIHSVRNTPFGIDLDRLIPTLAGSRAIERRDPNSLYWKHTRPTSESREWVLECDAFRHQHEPHTLEIVVRPDVTTGDTASGAIRCSAHASNLPACTELVVPVRIQIERGNTVQRVREELFRLR
ncbi:PIN domain-containing protein [Burkholderia oklahomensis]|uniref:PIN domain-containing protein n=1 Tax=Burkholderia oklahomensis TaxID=342113 RepID=UPI00016A83B8|nr:PIN domain-containing protein [Burkholderia oklahomensis]AJX32003.1 PIN domain protein [Burkholderia oklahomensis C6786]AOI46331.1 hypothetical protein WI23_11390 [Burkholderia oklahomensis C6786]KUY52854.1 hypothetical protein WI23_23955 [Burkholderia oklahomensis C6786]MBI0361074.1 hypothetical protein [Burkholderia oklahomensis]SUW60452.1 Predicted ATPase related to phosphate starvation-inducible protein PhoH [Burkholderia oklahomensis]